MGNIDSIISAYIKADPNNSNTGLAKLILAEYPECNLKLRTIRWKITNIKRSNPEAVTEITVPTIDEKESEEFKYYVSDGDYNLTHHRGDVKIPVKVIDDIFCDYSKHGYNLSGDEVIAKYDLKPHEWLAIKNSLNLYKTSDIVSPYTKENTPQDELEDLMDKKISQMFRNKGVITKKYRQNIERGYKKVILKDSEKEAERSTLINEIFDEVYVLKGKKYMQCKVTNPKNSTIGVVVISDLHLGASVKTTKTIPGFTMFDVKQALMDASKEINKYEYSKVYVIILGDLIHSFTGDMHNEMWREMDVVEGIGGKLIINTVNVLTEFCNSIINLEEIHSVSGNHDRHGKERERVGQELSLIIYEMLKRTLTVPVIFHGIKGMITVDGINYIMSHGEVGLDNRDVYRMLNRFGSPSGFTLVLKGHKHSRMIGSAEDNYDNRRMHCPSFFTIDSYTESLGFHACAGFLVIEKGQVANGIALPLIHDHSIRIS